jgi:biopolymer transport protein ExbD
MTKPDADTLHVRRANSARPYINVTPLIDVLLVLLIIFMVATPLRPAKFQAQVPQEPQPDEIIDPNPLTLVVSISGDGTLKVNEKTEAGTILDMKTLADKLKSTFAEREANGIMREGLTARTDLPLTERIERTVHVKAPRSIAYGTVVKVIDTIKGAGARPIGLQIDDLAL